MKRTQRLITLAAWMFILVLQSTGLSAAALSVTLLVPNWTTTYVAPAAPVLYATAGYAAFPPPATVVRVEFFDGDVKIGSVTSSNAVGGGYALVWTNAGIGPHSITARATDSLGAVADSAAVRLHVIGARTPPVVSITAPAAGQTFTASSVVQLQASASSAQGAVQRVEFVAGTAVVATSLSSPYSGTWINPLPGEYAVVARAVDELGVTSVSAPVHVQVLPRARPPVTVVTSPHAGSAIMAGTPLTLAASALAPDTDLARVDFMNGSVLLGSASAPPYQFVWSAPPAGSLSITAKAYDTQGNTGASLPVVGTATAPSLPVVSLSAPTSGMTFIAPDPITLAASAGTLRPGGRIVKVDFYDGTKLIGSTATAPFTYSWTGAAVGTHAITAKATDELAVVGTSAAVSVVVVANKAPTVALTSPTQGFVFVAGQSIGLGATAADSDGTIAKVEFLSGATVLATTTTAPYTFAWSGVPVGTYAVAARATDNRGLGTTSSARTVQVAATSTPTATLSAPSSGAAYAQGQPIALSGVGTMPGRTLARIEFLADGVVLGSVAYSGPSTATATFNWTTASLGAHSVAARAVATDGTTVTSTATPVVVRDLTVELFEPTAGQVYVAPGAIRLTAFAAETGTSIKQVEFLRGATVIGTVLTPPYTFDWTGVAAGVYTLAARATDASGLLLTSKPATVQVVSTPSLAIDAGTDGATVTDDNLLIGGTLLAPANSAISIGGQLAALDPQGRFFANGVKLQSGTNQLTLTLTTADGQTVVKTISVNSTSTAPFTVTVDQQEGMAPMSATMSITNRGAVPFQRIEIDTNDNGTPESTITSLTDGVATVALTYTTPATYVVRVTVFDASNKVIYLTRRKIHVYDAKALGARVSGVYTGMLRRLAAGDISNAVNAITATTRDVYRNFFTAVGSALPAVIQKLGRISDITVTESYADISLQRDTANGPYESHVLLIRDSDGIWRIDQM